MLTESLVVVFRVARQPEERRSHLLTALVQVLRRTHTARKERSPGRSPISWKRAGVDFALHLNELGVALAGGGAVVVLQELGQQSHALLHFLDGVHPLGHLLCSLLVLRATKPRPRELRDH